MGSTDLDWSQTRIQEEVMFKSATRIAMLGMIFMFNLPLALAQNDIAPPQLGEETKGTPAESEDTPLVTTNVPKGEKASTKKDASGSGSPFGDTIVKESKRESGQRYLIEFESSLGGKQYMEETDSDGKIESTSNDIEETPNLPKWKIGSW